MTTFYFDSFLFNKEKGTVSFYYHIDKGESFEEVITFPNAPFQLDNAQEQVLHQILFLAHIACGISYYKAFLCDEIRVLSGVLTKEQAAFFDAFYLKGLGEFAVQNHLNLQGKIHFPYGQVDTDLPQVSLNPSALVPVGGGKDSCVVMALMKDLGVSSVGVSCGTSRAQKDCCDKMNVPYLVFLRQIDKRLLQLNQEGKVFNGHIPITGVLAFLLWALAILRGDKYVVMACEKSANSGNLMQGDLVINHQWSKSVEFEKMFASMTQKITPDFRYFSLLRPISEAHIAKLFCEKCTPCFDVFTSCNKAFKLDLNKRIDRWCGECDKCRFVFLILAPFMDKTTLVRLVGRNPLNESEQIQGYQELLGLSGHKPFECVGEVDECRWAFYQLKMHPDWQEDVVVRALDVPMVHHPFDVSAEHFIPEELANVMADFEV